MIIFDERQRIESLLANGFQSNTALLDFILLGKYLIYNGLSGNELKAELAKILSDKQDLIPASYLPTIIPKIIRVAQNNPLQEKKVVEITKNEMDLITSFSEKAQRIAFIYLVCYKFYGKEFLIKPAETKKLAKITNMRNNQLFMLENELFEKGFLKEKETRTEIYYIVNLPENDNSEVVIRIDDYRELILYYDRYMGVDIINCKECNKLIKRNSNAQIYCRECKKEKNKEKVIRYRQKNAQNQEMTPIEN